MKLLRIEIDFFKEFMETIKSLDSNPNFNHVIVRPITRKDHYIIEISGPDIEVRNYTNEIYILFPQIEN